MRNAVSVGTKNLALPCVPSVAPPMFRRASGARLVRSVAGLVCLSLGACVGGEPPVAPRTQTPGL